MMRHLIPGMYPWKQNLLICALTAAVVFEKLPLWSHAFRETKVPLPENVLKIFLGIRRSNFFTLRWMSERSTNLCPFRIFFYIWKEPNILRGLVYYQHAVLTHKSLNKVGKIQCPTDFIEFSLILEILNES